MQTDHLYAPPEPHRWRRDSTFGPGPRSPLNRDSRARFKFLLGAHARANRIPAKQEKVGLALLKRLGTTGQCDPAYATLAADTGVSARTVHRATATMRRLGLLSWQRRLVRDGWGTSQTSNAYVLNPDPAFVPVVSYDGQTGRQTGLGMNIPRLPSASNRPERFPEATESERNAARAALAARQRMMEARMLGER